MEHENWYWEVEEAHNALVGKLHFTQFYDDEVILSWQLNDSEPDTFYYVSSMLNVEQDAIFADNPDEAMEEFADMVIEHIEDKISYYEDMLDKFKEEKEK